MSAIFNPPKPRAPAPLPATPSKSDAGVQDAGADARKRISAGRSQTVLTSGLGAPSTANIATKTLLGQ